MKIIRTIAVATLSAFLCFLSGAAVSAQFNPGQVLTAAQLNAAFAAVVPVAGGVTMTGPLTIPTLSSSNVTITGSLTASGLVTLPSLATQAANTVIANVTGSTASPTAFAMPSCSGANNALRWTSGTGFACASSIALTSSGLNQFAATTSAQLSSIVSDETGSGSLVFGTSPTLAGTVSLNGVLRQTDTTNNTSTLGITSTGGNGAGITLTGNGATTPSKTIRANGGNLQVVNSGYSAAILTLTDAGGLSVPNIDSTPVGAFTPSTGAFTALSASSTVSGTGFSNYLASPPAIGGTAASSGTFSPLVVANGGTPPGAGAAINAYDAGTIAPYTSPGFNFFQTEAYSAGSGNFHNGMVVQLNRTGGSGNRNALYSIANSSSGAAGEFVVGAQLQGNLTGGSGLAFGSNPYVQIKSGVASTAEAVGEEINTDVQNASVNRKVGLQIVDVATSTGGSSNISAAQLIEKQVGGAGWATGIQFGDDYTSGSGAITGALIRTGNASSAATVTRGIDFRTATFTAAALDLPSNGAGGGAVAWGAGAGGGIFSQTASAAPALIFGNGSLAVQNNAQSSTAFSINTGTNTAAAVNFTASGLITPTSTIGIKGTATNDNAQAGSIGEAPSATGSSTGLTSGTVANLTSISLTAGDWDVSAVVNFAPAASTVMSQIIAGTSTTSAALDSFGTYQLQQLAFPAGTAQYLAAPRRRLSISATTTIYCIGESTFTTSTNSGVCTMYARRAR